jgi:hypothetical protein
MGLSSTITDLVSTAFDILDDLPVSATYIEQTVGVYDPETGLVGHTEVTHSIPKCVFAQFTQKEMEKDESINGVSDQKMLFPRKGLTFDINDNDVILDAAGIYWDIVKAKSVPGDSVAILQLRRR